MLRDEELVRHFQYGEKKLLLPDVRPIAMQSISCSLLLLMFRGLWNIGHVPKLSGRREWQPFAISTAATHTHTHTPQFNAPLSGTTQVSRYQKGKTNLDFTEARDSEWQWFQLAHIACRSRQITMPAPYHSLFTGRMPFLPPNQQRQSTEGNSVVQQLIILILT